jgi:hypothetical protein
MDKATLLVRQKKGGTGGGTEDTVQRQPVILGEVLTGDYAPIFWIGVLLICSVGVMIFMTVKKQRSKK